MTDRMFCHFGPFSALLPSQQPKKSKFQKPEKKKKKSWIFLGILKFMGSFEEKLTRQTHVFKYLNQSVRRIGE